MPEQKLLKYILSHKSVRQKILLRQLGIEYKNKVNKSPHLLCDLHATLNWLLTQLGQQEHQSPFSHLHGDDVQLYSQKMLSFVQLLDECGVEPVFYISAPSGYDAQELKDRFSHYKAKSEQNCADAVSIHQVCSGMKGVCKVESRPMEFVALHVEHVLRKANVLIVYLTAGIVSELHYYWSNYKQICGVLTNNTDLLVVCGLKVFFPELLKIENNESSLIEVSCEYVNSSQLASSLEISESRLTDLALLCNNMESACLALKLQTSDVVAIARWLKEQKKPLKRTEELQEFFTSSVLWQYDMELSISSFSSGAIVDCIKNGSMSPHLLALANGCFLRPVICEDFSVNSPCFPLFTLSIRKRLYAFLGKRKFTEYGCTMSRVFEVTSGEVSTETPVFDEIYLFNMRKSPLNIRLAILFHTILGQPNSDELTRQGSTDWSVIVTHLVVCSSLLFMSLSRDGFTPSSKMTESELDTLVLTCLVSLIGVKVDSLPHCPKSRGVTINAWFTHVLQQVLLVASLLNLTDSLPPPGDMFSSQAFFTFYRASCEKVEESDSLSGAEGEKRESSLCHMTVDNEPSLQATVKHYRDLLRLKPVSALCNLVHECDKVHSYPIVVHMFSEAVQAVQIATSTIVDSSAIHKPSSVSAQPSAAIDDLLPLMRTTGLYNSSTSESLENSESHFELPLQQDSELLAEDNHYLFEDQQAENETEALSPFPAIEDLSDWDEDIFKEFYSHSKKTNDAPITAADEPDLILDVAPNPKKEKKCKTKPKRNSLPIFEHRSKILELINTHRVVMIEGDTGCGKSTKVPQFILDQCLRDNQEVKIIVTQPRRVAAIKLAEHVAAERGEELGRLVGFCIGGESQRTNTTALTYCTIGYLLQMILHNPELMQSYTHIILDEIHERSISTEFALLVIRKLSLEFTNIKIILMSATLEGQLFLDYFERVLPSADVAKPYFVGVKRYAVTTYFINELDELTDKKLIWHDKQLQAAHNLNTLVLSMPQKKVHALRKIKPVVTEFMLKVCTELIISQGNRGESILIFMPGIGEIMSYHEKVLQELHNRGISKYYKFFVLHSQVPLEEQTEVFSDPPQNGVHVILATNIAESSLTLPKLRLVINFGLYRQMQYDSKRGISCLRRFWCSRASCAQRAGRVGRVFEGVIVHLFSYKFYNVVLPEYNPPEIITASLAKLVLQAKSIANKLGFSTPSEVLSQALEPPSLEQLEAALKDLANLGAIVSQPDRSPCEMADMTILGEFSLIMPMDVDLCRLVLYGMFFGLPTEAIVIAAEILQTVDVFSLPTRCIIKDKAEFKSAMVRSLDTRVNFDGGQFSDHLMVCRLFKEWIQCRRTNARSSRPLSKFKLVQGFVKGQALRCTRLFLLEVTIAQMATRLLSCIPKNSDIYKSIKVLSNINRYLELSETDQLEIQFCDDPLLVKSLLTAAYAHQLIIGQREDCSSFPRIQQEAKIELNILEKLEMDPTRSIVMRNLPQKSLEYLNQLIEWLLPDTDFNTVYIEKTAFIHFPELMVCDDCLTSPEIGPCPKCQRPVNWVTFIREMSVFPQKMHKELYIAWQFGERQSVWCLEGFNCRFTKFEHPLALSWENLSPRRELVAMASYRNPSAFMCDFQHHDLPYLAVATSLQGGEHSRVINARKLTILPSIEGGVASLLLVVGFQPLHSDIELLVEQESKKITGIRLGTQDLIFGQYQCMTVHDIIRLNILRQSMCEALSGTSSSGTFVLPVAKINKILSLLKSVLAQAPFPVGESALDHARPKAAAVAWERQQLTREEYSYAIDDAASDTEFDYGSQTTEVDIPSFKFYPSLTCSLLDHVTFDEAQVEDCLLNGPKQSNVPSNVITTQLSKLSPLAEPFVPTGSLSTDSTHSNVTLEDTSTTGENVQLKPPPGIPSPSSSGVYYNPSWSLNPQSVYFVPGFPLPFWTPDSEIVEQFRKWAVHQFQIFRHQRLKYCISLSNSIRHPLLLPLRPSSQVLQHMSPTFQQGSPPSQTSCQVSPASQVSQQMSPASQVSQQMSPPSQISHRVSPASQVSQQMSPPSQISHRVSPASQVSQQMSPPSQTSCQVSPASQVSQQTSPPSQISHQVSPASQVSQQISPSSQISHRVSPASQVSQQTSPPSKTSYRVSQQVSPLSQASQQGTPPSHKVSPASQASYRVLLQSQASPKVASTPNQQHTLSPAQVLRKSPGSYRPFLHIPERSQLPCTNSHHNFPNFPAVSCGGHSNPQRSPLLPIPPILYGSIRDRRQPLVAGPVSRETIQQHHHRSMGQSPMKARSASYRLQPRHGNRDQSENRGPHSCPKDPRHLPIYPRGYGMRPQWYPHLHSTTGSHPHSVTGSREVHLHSKTGSQEAHVHSVTGSQEPYSHVVTGSREAHSLISTGLGAPHPHNSSQTHTTRMCTHIDPRSFVQLDHLTLHSVHLGFSGSQDIDTETHTECYNSKHNVETQEAHPHTQLESQEATQMESQEAHPHTRLESQEAHPHTQLESQEATQMESQEAHPHTQLESQEATQMESQEAHPHTQLESQEAHPHTQLESQEAHPHTQLESQTALSHTQLESQEATQMESQEAHPHTQLESQEAHPHTQLESQEAHPHTQLESQKAHPHTQLESQEAHPHTLLDSQKAYAHTQLESQEAHPHTLLESQEAHLHTLESQEAHPHTQLESQEAHHHTQLKSQKAHPELSTLESQEAHLHSLKGPQETHLYTLEQTPDEADIQLESNTQVETPKEEKIFLNDLPTVQEVVEPQSHNQLVTEEVLQSKSHTIQLTELDFQLDRQVTEKVSELESHDLHVTSHSEPINTPSQSHDSLALLPEDVINQDHSTPRDARESIQHIVAPSQEVGALNSSASSYTGQSQQKKSKSGRRKRKRFKRHTDRSERRSNPPLLPPPVVPRYEGPRLFTSTPLINQQAPGGQFAQYNTPPLFQVPRPPIVFHNRGDTSNPDMQQMLAFLILNAPKAVIKRAEIPAKTMPEFYGIPSQAAVNYFKHFLNFILPQCEIEKLCFSIYHRFLELNKIRLDAVSGLNPLFFTKRHRDVFKVSYDDNHQCWVSLAPQVKQLKSATKTQATSGNDDIGTGMTVTDSGVCLDKGNLAQPEMASTNGTSLTEAPQTGRIIHSGSSVTEDPPLTVNSACVNNTNADPVTVASSVDQFDNQTVLVSDSGTVTGLCSSATNLGMDVGQDNNMNARDTQTLMEEDFSALDRSKVEGSMPPTTDLCKISDDKEIDPLTAHDQASICEETINYQTHPNDHLDTNRDVHQMLATNDEMKVTADFIAAADGLIHISAQTDVLNLTTETNFVVTADGCVLVNQPVEFNNEGSNKLTIDMDTAPGDLVNKQRDLPTMLDTVLDSNEQCVVYETQNQDSLNAHTLGDQMETALRKEDKTHLQEYQTMIDCDQQFSVEFGLQMFSCHDIDTQINAQIDTQIDTQTDTQVGAQIDTRIDAQIDAHLGGVLAEQQASIDAQLEAASDAKIYNASKQIENSIDPEPGPEKCVSGLTKQGDTLVDEVDDKGNWIPTLTVNQTVEDEMEVQPQATLCTHTHSQLFDQIGDQIGDLTLTPTIEDPALNLFPEIIVDTTLLPLEETTLHFEGKAMEPQCQGACAKDIVLVEESGQQEFVAEDDNSSHRSDTLTEPSDYLSGSGDVLATGSSLPVYSDIDCRVEEKNIILENRSRSTEHVTMLRTEIVDSVSSDVSCLETYSHGHPVTSTLVENEDLDLSRKLGQVLGTLLPSADHPLRSPQAADCQPVDTYIYNDSEPTNSSECESTVTKETDTTNQSGKTLGERDDQGNVEKGLYSSKSSYEEKGTVRVFQHAISEITSQKTLDSTHGVKTITGVQAVTLKGSETIKTDNKLPVISKQPTGSDLPKDSESVTTATVKTAVSDGPSNAARAVSQSSTNTDTLSFTQEIDSPLDKDYLTKESLPLAMSSQEEATIGEFTVPTKPPTKKRQRKKRQGSSGEGRSSRDEHNSKGDEWQQRQLDKPFRFVEYPRSVSGWETLDMPAGSQSSGAAASKPPTPTANKSPAQTTNTSSDPKKQPSLPPRKSTSVSSDHVRPKVNEKLSTKKTGRPSTGVRSLPHFLDYVESAVKASVDNRLRYSKICNMYRSKYKLHDHSIRLFGPAEIRGQSKVFSVHRIHGRAYLFQASDSSSPPSAPLFERRKERGHSPPSKLKGSGHFSERRDRERSSFRHRKGRGHSPPFKSRGSGHFSEQRDREQRQDYGGNRPKKW